MATSSAQLIVAAKVSSSDAVGGTSPRSIEAPP